MEDKTSDEHTFIAQHPEPLTHSRAFVAVLSPRYINAESCRQELSLFCEKEKALGSFNVLKVIKTPIEREHEPAELVAYLGVDFFREDESGRVSELYPLRRTDRDDGHDFWRRLEDVAHCIKQWLVKPVPLSSVAPLRVQEEMEGGTAPDPPPLTNVSVVATPGLSAKTVFLCYRREDTQDAAGRLHDRLVDAYGEERVFIDIDSVPLGIDFVEHVAEQIGKCSAVIVMIGKQWHTIKDKKRRRRLDNEDDLVRAEIRAALQQKIPVIPVTVQNATMPQTEDLPDDIRLLARRNGISLSATRWKTDVERLIKELDRVMKG